MTKYLISLVLAVVIGLAIYGGYQYPKSSFALGSAAGTTFGVEQQAAVVISLATPGVGATSTSITNTDTGNRYISSWKVGCSGVGTSQAAYTGSGLASLQLTVATTSTANPATIPVGWADLVNAQALSTSSVQLLVASSTLQSATSSLPSVWHSGEFLTFWFNATNTAACTIGVNYFQS